MSAPVGTALTPMGQGVEDDIVADVEAGVPFQTAMIAHGVEPKMVEDVLAVAAGRKPFSTEMKAAPEVIQRVGALMVRIRQAQAKVEAEAIKRINQAALAVNEKTGVPEWRAGAWMLNNSPATRRTYHEYKELHLENNRELSPEHRLVANMSDAEVTELLPAEWQELLDEPPHGQG